MLSGMGPLLNILYEDDDLLVVNKPADLVCHPSKNGPTSSLIGRIRLHLGDPGESHLINRLDRETSGIVLTAKNLAYARTLRRLWEQHQVTKEYWGIVHGHPEKPHAIIEKALGKDTASAVAIKDCVRADGLPAYTEFWVLHLFDREGAPFALLRIRPRSGRKHQIRIHLASIGHPIVGDKLYGSNEEIYLDFVRGKLSAAQKKILFLPNQALHSYLVRFPWEESQKYFFAPADSSFMGFLPSVLFKTLPVLGVPNKIQMASPTRKNVL